jgi:hypothetical protein
MCARGFANANAIGQRLADCLLSRTVNAWAPEALAFRFRPPETSAHALLNHRREVLDVMGAPGAKRHDRLV